MNPRDIILEALWGFNREFDSADKAAAELLAELAKADYVIVKCGPLSRVVVSRESKPCEHCKGTGGDSFCNACRGSGVVEATTTRPMPDLTAEQCEWARRWAATQPYGTNATDAVARIVNAVLAAVALPEESE